MESHWFLVQKMGLSLRDLVLLAFTGPDAHAAWKWLFGQGEKERSRKNNQKQSIPKSQFLRKRTPAKKNTHQAKQQHETQFASSPVDCGRKLCFSNCCLLLFPFENIPVSLGGRLFKKLFYIFRSWIMIKNGLCTFSPKQRTNMSNASFGKEKLKQFIVRGG